METWQEQVRVGTVLAPAPAPAPAGTEAGAAAAVDARCEWVGGPQHLHLQLSRVTALATGNLDLWSPVTWSFWALGAPQSRCPREARGPPAERAVCRCA